VYPSARDQGVTEELVSAVHNDPQGERFDEREKAAFRLVDVIAGDHHKASDALYDDLREHFTEREIITLGWRISMFMGYGRLLATLGMDTVGEACVLPAAAAG
jgi:alkylhydroperoxidase family enzyme